ncbi:MAG: peptidoglycan bridge formation glycyltransferase FemA/FemB family protein [Clostridiales bacterium]|nr:peptidoglycan bridge formation glycyltransferase FemA/FemB family protein [Clostridiales bacterium]
MPIERVNKSNLAEYEAFIKSHPKGLFQQSSKWAKVKSAWKWEAIMLRDESGKIKGSAAALIRFIPVIKYSLFYVCRGFAADENDFETFDALFKGLLELAKEYKAYCIKIDPEITADNKEYKNHLLEKGFKELNPGCMDFENVQPRFVYCFDYNGMNEEELMLTFKPDYRTRIRKAAKKGVQIKIQGVDALDDFVRIMDETGTRDGFSTRPKWYFEKILNCMGEDARLYMAYYDGQAIAGTIAVKWEKNVMKYQYGASSNSHRNVYPNYALQWEMMKWGMECECAVYDFGGISGDCQNPDNPHYGLWRFKHGFGGYMKEFIGEFDYVINSPVYKIYNIAMDLKKKIK